VSNSKPDSQGTDIQEAKTLSDRRIYLSGASQNSHFAGFLFCFKASRGSWLSCQPSGIVEAWGVFLSVSKGFSSYQCRHRFGFEFLSSRQGLQIDFVKMVNITERIKECGDSPRYGSISILTLT